MLGCVVKKKLALKDKGSEGFNNNDSYNDSHDDNGDHKNSSSKIETRTVLLEIKR